MIVGPGSSPRARSGSQVYLRYYPGLGLISARGADEFHGGIRVGDGGSSPQARSGRLVPDLGQCRQGLISAGAERTCGCSGRPGWCRAHLRRRGADWECRRAHASMGAHLRRRGADRCCVRRTCSPAGSSPQARCGRSSGRRRTRRGGLISAGAERTYTEYAAGSASGGHLRRRGADAGLLTGLLSSAGSSPQARSGHGFPVRTRR